MSTNEREKTPFQRVVDDLTGGCGCGCHTGIGYNTACRHCVPQFYPPERSAGAAPIDDGCECHGGTEVASCEHCVVLAGAAPIDALRHLFFIMERLDKQAGPPFADDHFVKVTTETWLDVVRPAIQTVRARLSEGTDR